MAKKFDFLSPGVEIREIDQSIIPQEAEAAGPIIIGRTRKGPANKPVRVRNLDDFVSVFGLPVAGGNGTQGDIWREGNTVGPTYASYAAQAWLASENSPVTVVRLAGEQHSAVETGGEAGWQVGSAGITATNNSTAYGLFLCDEADSAESSNGVLSFGSNNGTVATYNGDTLIIKRGTTIQVTFTFDNADTSKNGTVERTGSKAIKVHTYGLTAAQFMALIETAFELAISEGFLASISLQYATGGVTLRIFNLDTTASSQLEFLDSTSSNFKVSINGATAARTDSGNELNIPVSTRNLANGSLAAVFYCVTGALALQGPESDGQSPVNPAVTGQLIDSIGADKEFKLAVYTTSSAAPLETINFNFSRNGSKYLRNVLNTNPQLTNTTTISSEDQKTYWLGESFLDHLSSNVTSSASGEVYGILLPLGTGAGASANWGYHRYAAREAKSGWVFSDKSTNQQKLFRFKSMHVGEEIQRNYMIAIEQIAAPANSAVDAYGSFTVCIKDIAGNNVERYTGCNLNPASPNYVAARIGDQYQQWSDTDKRYRTYGDFQNLSDIFYIEMNENIANGGGQGLLPAGFYGPVRPQAFSLQTGASQVKTTAGVDMSNPVVQGAASQQIFAGHGAGTGIIADLGDLEGVQFEFPKMRMRDLGTDGGAADQARTYWGIRPKLSAQSTQHDPDYIDYTRALGMEQGEEGTHTPGTGFEYSFIFTLDDVSGSGTTWSWTEGNYTNAVGAVSGDGASFTSKAGNTFADLLDQNVRQFIMPVWGGSEGFDITEMEPLRNELISDTTLAEKTNYVDYTISKALDSVADEEVVPANLLLMPGIWRPSATNKVINVAESRKDVLSIIDLQGDYRPRAEVNDTAVNRLGSVTSAVTNLKSRNLNSSYACAFYPSVQISDNLNGGQLVWIPSSIAALGALGKSQAQSELWFAPAGFNRGGLGSLGGPRGPSVIQARQRLDSKERDLLYERNINPIATFPAEGIVIFGQKTLQADASALDRINVRRLVLFLKAEVSRISRNLLFDQNLDSTWNRFRGQVEPIMSSVKSRFGLSDYKVILDSTTTTADLVDRNIMYAKIYIKPARAIEYIVVDFVITRTGADFV